MKDGTRLALQQRKETCIRRFDVQTMVGASQGMLEMKCGEFGNDRQFMHNYYRQLSSGPGGRRKKWEGRFVANNNRKKMPYPVDMHWFLHVVVREELASAHRLEHVSHDAGVVNDCEEKKKNGEGKKKKEKKPGNERGAGFTTNDLHRGLGANDCP